MNEQLKNFWEVSKGIWASLGTFQKLSILIIGLFCFSGIGAVLYYGSQPEWHTLFTGVDAENMSKIQNVLREENVPTKLKDNGKTIQIPSKYASQMKLKILADPTIIVDADSKDPYDYINTMPIGMAHQEKKIAYIRAQEKNLESKINLMPRVISSSVTLNIPERRAFQAEKNPSASVMLKVRHADYINPDQIESIRHLISGAVNGLQSGKVTVVDSNGRLLARSHDGEEMKSNLKEKTRREMKSNLENYFRHKVEHILSPAVGGPEKIVAMVDVDLEFSQEERKVETFDSQSKVTITEKTITERTDGPGNVSTSGETGTAANAVQKISVKNPEGSSVTQKSSDVSREIKESTSEVPKTVSFILKNGAEIKKISVAVNIASPTDKPWGDEDLKKFEELVRNAVGFVESDPISGRKDAVKVAQTTFNIPVAAVVEPPVIESVVEKVDHYMGTSLVKNILGGFLLLALLIFYKKIFSAERIESQEITSDDMDAEFVEDEMVRAQRLAEEADIALLEAEMSKEMEAIKGATQKEPKAIASVIEQWVMAKEEPKVEGA
ncbi:MAG: flagellar M-ring protein FliF [Lentisphaeraceae bacterium]|nr:flagellar M-ring protein FliF [Lentisphaeraceae bacterium]